MAGMNATKRFIVRTSLVTGSTIATVVGAQSLITLDNQQFNNNDGGNFPVESQPFFIDTNTVNQLPTTVPSPTVEAVEAAPNIVIIRRPGNTNTTILDNAATGNTSTSQINSPSVSIQPPNPVQVAAPPPVVVQQPAQQIVQVAPAPRPATRPSR